MKYTPIIPLNTYTRIQKLGQINIEVLIHNNSLQIDVP